jgi:hypothetical protein
LNPPPIPLSCIEAVRWRNQRCTNFGADFLSFGTEYDWLGFYYGVGEASTPEARWSMFDIFNAYNTACGNNDPNQLTSCLEAKVSWAGNPDPQAPAFSLRDGATAWAGASSLGAAAFRIAGDTFGVSDQP